MAVVIGLLLLICSSTPSHLLLSAPLLFSSIYVYVPFLDMSTNDSKLFSSIKYFTTGFRDQSLEKTFKENGAILSFYLTETTTHVICDDFDSNKSELEQAIEIYQTPIVKSEWISACLKCNALLPIEPFRSVDTDPTDNLFRSCIFANANLTLVDHYKVYALATYYGGQWSSNIDNQVCTHIICASGLFIQDPDIESHHENERLRDAYELHSEKLHLITPDWIIDSVNAGRLLDEAEYHPDLLRDPNEPMDVDEDEAEDENQNDSTNNQSTEEHSPVKTTGGSHRTQLITKNFFNQADQTTPPHSTEPVQEIQDSNNTTDMTVSRSDNQRLELKSKYVDLYRMFLKRNQLLQNDRAQKHRQRHDSATPKSTQIRIIFHIICKMDIHRLSKTTFNQRCQSRRSLFDHLYR